jgi:hypothetical protein
MSLAYYGLVNTGAANGKAGTLLLDPIDARIDTVAGPNVITVAAIQAALANGDLIVTTGDNGNQPGDLTVAAPITWATTSALGLFSHRNVNINANVTNTSVNGAEVVLFADQTGTGTGTVFFNSGAQISTAGEVNIAYNPASYTSPTNWSPFVTGGGTATGYMLVNTATNLQDIGTNLAGNYVLGRDIDMANVTGFTPIGGGNAFTGEFFGFGNTISNLTISSATATNLGLFSLIGSGGKVEDLTLSNVTVTSTATGGANVGVLAGQNEGHIHDIEIENSIVNATSGPSNAGGLVGRNTWRIIDSKAEVDVTVAANSTAGGLVGLNVSSGSNRIERSSASGNVVGGNSDIGGLVGKNDGLVLESKATGNVNITNITGTPSAGGLVGYNNSTGEIRRSAAFGNVTSAATAASDSVGGLVGENLGSIYQSYALGEVTGSSSAYAGGLVGFNHSSAVLDEVFATGAASGHSGFTGGLIGNNQAAAINTTSAYWDNVGSGLANGVGTSSSGCSGCVSGFPLSFSLPTLPLDFDSVYWTINVNRNNGFPHLKWETLSPLQDFPLNVPTILRSTLTGFEDITQDVIDLILIETIIAHILQNATVEEQQEIMQALIELTQPAAGPSGDPNQPGGSGPGGSQPGARGAINPATGMPPQPLRPISGPDGERFSSIPPIGETRFLNNEVVVQVPESVSPEQVAQIAKQLGLSVITSQNLGALGRRAYRFNLPSGRNVRDMIRALEANSIVAVAQPNYRFRLGQAGIAPASAPSDTPELTQRGDPSQYMMGKLHLAEAHRLADGRNILVAVIDSEIDKDHSELRSSIAARFATSEDADRPHSHGTAMAGAIASRDRLLGVAPSARILAIRAFSESNNTAESTTFSILKSIDHAVNQGAKVINMSFAGPPDPSLHRTLKAAAEKGVILIAAAGNAGPKSPPLFPAADPNVIAVTATDSSDRVFKMANRGPHIEVAAPGVDILAPAPQAGYQMSTGTSIATAHVSGVVALMLEKDPTLKPADVRQILQSTARDLGPKGKDPNFGWGLVDPHKALQAVMLRDAARKRQQTQ